MSSAVAHPVQTPQQYTDTYDSSASQLPQSSPELPSGSPSARRQQQQQQDFAVGNGAPPNTPASTLPYSSNPSTAMNTPRAQQYQGPTSARATPASRSSAAHEQDPYYSGRSDKSTISYRNQAPNSSPYSERQDSARTSVPYNTPEFTAAFDLDRSREDAGSTPGIGQQKQKKTDKRIFSEPVGSSRPPVAEDTRQARQPIQSRSAEALTDDNASLSAPPMSREDSAIINRLVITDPQEDLERERARVAESQPGRRQGSSHSVPVTGLGLVGGEETQEHAESTPPVQQRSRQEHLRNAQPRRETKFGDYILGQTIGEGEFGKVKLGWKRSGGIQVAIKLIRRDSLGNNPNRLPKIYREIAILRGLQHPNIVRLHEMVETERHIGIILEYASGGELFDYILNHRYLKDHAARRLFAQLVSGVGYLHKKGIVHRDLKLENLLLDRNKNIIITDFGFANTFNPHDELGEEIEYNLSNKEFVQRTGLEQIRADGHRRGDLMQTSCGSPCYAAPELVVSDSLYTGRKVDVWSCGVILYAMLAGYLPFDDDPANPEGDNINLLYKYIVSTPLTFPEYVTPHARDLLRRILVPDPRKRADLFEVARHSWLSDYAHVVSFITSTSTAAEAASPTIAAAPHESPMASGLGRSASVREPTKASPLIGAPARSPNMPSEERQKKDRDAKRRTVQLEYVAPQTATARGATQTQSPYASPQITSGGTPKTRARGDSASREAAPVSAPVQELPATSATSANTRPVTMTIMPPPTRTTRVEVPRAVSDSTAFVGSPVSSSTGRPSTRGSATGVGAARLPSRGNSYGQPSAATVAPTNAEGRFSQPQRSSVVITNPPDFGKDPETGRPMSMQFSGYDQTPVGEEAPRPKHKRTNTMESFTSKLFGRSNSTRRQSQYGDAAGGRPEKKNRQYPPVSMNGVVINEPANDQGRRRRPSTDSRRSSIFNMYGKKDEDTVNKRASKRFSFIPQAFSRLSISGPGGYSGKDESAENKRMSMQAPPSRRQDSKMMSGMGYGQGADREAAGSAIPTLHDSQLEPARTLPTHVGPQRGVTSPDLLTFASQGYSSQQNTPRQGYRPPSSQTQDRFYTPDSTQEMQPADATLQHPFQDAPGPILATTSNESGVQPARRQHATLQKANRKFGEDTGPSGSSNGARRVMNWFRNRGRERGG